MNVQPQNRPLSTINTNIQSGIQSIGESYENAREGLTDTFNE